MEILQILSGHEVIELSSIDSTNNYAANLFKTGNPADGTVIMSHEQTHGRGQRGTVWQSNKDQNLTFSLLLRPNFLPLEHQFKLNQAISLSLIDYLTHFLQANIQIKWPNDILVNGIKVSGILIENSIFGKKMEWSVVGIGMNLNQSEFTDFQATSLFMLTGRTFDSKECLANFLKHFNRRYDELKSGQYTKLDADYRAALFNLGKEADYIIDGQAIKGEIVGVTERGLLCLNTANDQLRLDLKEIEFVKTAKA